MAELSPGAAERHLANQLRIQTAALARRGFEPEIIEVTLAECIPAPTTAGVAAA